MDGVIVRSSFFFMYFERRRMQRARGKREAGRRASFDFHTGRPLLARVRHAFRFMQPRRLQGPRDTARIQQMTVHRYLRD